MYRVRCGFAGHSKIECADMIRGNIIKYAEELILQYGVKEFFVGNYGEFDRCAASAVRKLKQNYNIKLVLVVPYITKEINDNREYYSNLYDEICLATISDNIPSKYKILYTNRYIAECCKFLIAYVNVGWGGAAKTLEYANKLNRCVTNLGTKKE